MTASTTYAADQGRDGKCNNLARPGHERSRKPAHSRFEHQHTERGAFRAIGTGTVIDEFLHSKGPAKRFLIDHVLTHSSDDCLIWPFSGYRDGYAQIVFKGRHYKISRLVCEVAHGKPEAGQQAAHSCGNNRCVNHRHLRWASAHENAADKREHGTHLHKLTVCEVRQIRLLQGSFSQRELAEKFSVSKITIQEILARKKWRWVE